MKHWGLLVILYLYFAFPALSRPEFDLIRISQADTSHSTVTCVAFSSESANYLYSGGNGNKIDAFEIDDGGLLIPVRSYLVSGGEEGVRSLSIERIGDRDLLFAGLKGGKAIEVFEIDSGGELRTVSLMKDSEGTYLANIIALQIIQLGSEPFVFAGGLEKRSGLSSYKVNSDGHMEHVQSVPDDEEVFTDGIIDMTFHQLDGRTYLFTGGFRDNGLSSWRVFEDGRFENVSNVGDDDRRFLNGTYPLVASTVGGWNYVIVGHRHHSYYEPGPWLKDQDTYFYHGDAVSVFLVDPDGRLIPRSLFVDDTETLIRGQTRLLSLPYNEDYNLVVIGTYDDQSIQVCVLNSSGRLYEAGQVHTGFPVYYGLCALDIGSERYLFAGSGSGTELVSYRLEQR